MLTLITLGKLKEKFYLSAAEEYEKRLKAYGGIRLIELPEVRLPEDPSPAQIRQALEREAESVRQKLPKNCWLCVLTPEGKLLSSEALAKTLQSVRNQGRSELVFLIGSSFGSEEAGRPPALHESHDLPPPSGPNHGAGADLPGGEHSRRQPLPQIASFFPSFCAFPLAMHPGGMYNLKD